MGIGTAFAMRAARVSCFLASSIQSTKSFFRE